LGSPIIAASSLQEQLPGRNPVTPQLQRHLINHLYPQKASFIGTDLSLYMCVSVTKSNAD